MPVLRPRLACGLRESSLPGGRLSFVDFDRQFLELSWRFFNDPEMKRLTKTPDFSRADQERWFAGLPKMRNYFAWGAMMGETPIGATGLKKVTPADGEYWGYIAERQFWGQGLGGEMVQFVLRQARGMGLLEVYLHVQCDNPRAVRLYTRMGFVGSGEQDGTLLMRLALAEPKVSRLLN